VNHYLCRSAPDVLGTNSKPNFQEEADILRSIFPDRKAIKSTHLRNVDSEIIGKIRFDEVAENILTDKQPHNYTPSSRYTAKKRSIHTDAYKHDIVNDARSVHTIASNTCNKKQGTEIAKPTFTNDNKMRARIKSSIEEYLQHYNDNIRKSRGTEEEEYSRDVKPSASDITDILESHNIGSHVLYENFEKHSDSYDSDDYMNENNEDYSTVTQMTSVNVENRKVRDNISFENMELCDDTRLTKAIDTRLFDHDNRRQSNCQDNAFINMGLNKDLSRETLSQILQSEYLRKDLSL